LPNAISKILLGVLGGIYYEWVIQATRLLDFFNRLLDHVDHRQEFANFCYPNVNYMVGKINKLPQCKHWDIIYCSNVIEHYFRPSKIIKQLINRAKGYVVFYAPYKEYNLCKGHRSVITEKTFDKFEPLKIKIINSLGWKKPTDANVEQILAIIPGIYQNT